jgi:prevent-host-death family protein
LTGRLDLAILAMMRRATITEAKNGLSALLDRVRAGESVVITDRGVPVAVLEPAPGRVDLDERIARLERAGIVRRGRVEPPMDLLRTPGPPLAAGASVVDAVLDERRSGW